MEIFLAIIEGEVGRFRTVTIDKKYGAIKLFSNSDFLNFNVKTICFAGLLNIQVVNCLNATYPSDNLKFSAKPVLDKDGMLTFGLKVVPLQQNQWCYMIVSWLTTNNTFIYVVSSPFVPMTRNFISKPKKGPVHCCTYVSTMHTEVRCIEGTNTPNESFLAKIFPEGLRFQNYVIYHHPETESAQHSAIAMQVVKDISDDFNAPDYVASCCYLDFAEQTFEDNGNKMISRFGQPVTKPFNFIGKGKGNARSHAQSRGPKTAKVELDYLHFDLLFGELNDEEVSRLSDDGDEHIQASSPPTETAQSVTVEDDHRPSENDVEMHEGETAASLADPVDEERFGDLFDIMMNNLHEMHDGHPQEEERHEGHIVDHSLKVRTRKLPVNVVDNAQNTTTSAAPRALSNKLKRKQSETALPHSKKTQHESVNKGNPLFPMFLQPNKKSKGV